jgi:hypothetical protein
VDHQRHHDDWLNNLLDLSCHLVSPVTPAVCWANAKCNVSRDFRHDHNFRIIQNFGTTYPLTYSFRLDAAHDISQEESPI